MILIVGDKEVEASKAQVEAYMTENLPTMLEVFGIDILDKHCASCELEVRIKE